MASVFVSYAREDAPKAKAIASALEESALEVWFDERIHSGSEYSREIENALARASAVLVLWSKNSIGSPWVRDEAAEGRDSGRLVSVTLDDCRPPIGFRQFQTTDLSQRSGRGTPDRLKDVIAAIHAKTGGDPISTASASVRKSHGRRLRPAWLAAALLLVVVTVAAVLIVRRAGNPPGRTMSVALLPFTADSSDAEARKLAAAARDSVADTLSQGAFAVRTVDAAQVGKPVADFLISGHMTRGAEKLAATVRMEETAHHVVVFSHTFETTRDKADEFPQLIGAQVASQLSWTAPMLAMERRHPSDPAIIAGLLQGSTAGLDSLGALHDYQTARRLAAQAPNSPLAQNSFAFNTAFALAEIPLEERAQAVAAARRAADRTLELAPEFGGAYIPYCLLHSEQRRVECEDGLRRGMRAEPDSAFANFFLSRLLSTVGRNREALELAKLSLGHDPYMPYKIGQTLRLLGLTGNAPEAAELYRNSARWWPANDIIKWAWFSGMIARGDFQSAEKAVEESGEKPSPVLQAIVRQSSAQVRALCKSPSEDDELPCMLALAKSGDMDEAYALADKIYPPRRGRTAADEERIWLEHPDVMTPVFITAPGAAPLRRDPRYVALAARVGLLSYWRSGRPPDFCRSNPEPICARLLPRR